MEVTWIELLAHIDPPGFGLYSSILRHPFDADLMNAIFSDS